jgi:putative two-component system response regulator
LRSRRPYKPALDHAAACGSILTGDSKSRPTHFDPAMLAVFKIGMADFRDIFETLRD